MPRKIPVTELYDIIARLRKGHGIREIHRALGVHRTIIRTLRDIAQEEGWLKPTCPLPTEGLIQRRMRHSLIDKPPRAHPLDAYRHDFQSWIDEGYTYVVMHQLIKDQYKCSESTVKRYLKPRFPPKPKPVMRRTAKPGEVMEVDFGYLGISYDPDSGRNRKTHLFSGRLRFSRLAYREIVFDQTGRTFVFLPHPLLRIFWRCTRQNSPRQPLLQGVFSSGRTYFVPPELRPSWAQNLNTISGAWLYYYGVQPTVSTGSLSTSDVSAHIDVERFDPTDTGLLKYDRHFYIQSR